ncbi:ATP-binding protein [uncultured Robinsoniella sp.]|uniref:ATP-binding protein n=1 Tax=uncultured Robinsoniella sp. TaxID=904190 RepID=UPI00374F9BE7
MQQDKKGYCFTAIVGQEDMKTALILNVINPSLGGVLIRGEKGTAKSTAVRALAELLPEREQVEGCRFSCDPHDIAHMCSECLKKKDKVEELSATMYPMQVIDLPVSATEDRVVGTLDMEYAIKTGEKKFETGILARANRNILYVDEVNLLDDHVVDVLLDSAAMGVNTVEREGVSYTHPAQFILVGTMNPEEGDLRPQLIDRFGLSVTVIGERDIERRVAVVESRLKFENDPEKFFAEHEPKQQELRKQIVNAQKLMPHVTYNHGILEKIAKICIAMDVDGHRADIVMLKTAMTLAAYHGRKEVDTADILESAKLVLPHRMRRKPFEDTQFDLSQLENIL